MKRTFLYILFGLFCCMSFAVCKARPAPSRYLLVLSKGDHMLAIVDAGNLKTIARVPVSEDPHEVVADAHGEKAYVTNFGGGAFHEINVIDLRSKKALATIDTRPLYGPHDITFVAGKVWFTAEGSKAVGRYDPATNTLDWSMGTGQDRTHMLHVTNDAKNIYTANIAGTVSILSASSQAGAGNTARAREDWSQTVVPTHEGSEGFDISPDGRTLWTASNKGYITIIDLDTKTQTAKIPADVNGANRLKFTPNGKLAFVSSLQTGELTIFNTDNRTLVKKIKLGRGAAGILMDGPASRAFVACSPDNYIAIIDLKTLEVTGKLDVGKVPDGMAWAIVK